MLDNLIDSFFGNNSGSVQTESTNEFAMRYPLDLNGYAHPSVMFTGYQSVKGSSVAKTNISLYMPDNYSMTDGASYGDFNLGILGKEAGTIVDFLAGDAKPEALEKTIKTATQASNDKALSTVIGAQAFANFGLGSESVKRAADLYLKNNNIAINPNTVLTYSNSTIRGFEFAFKLVASSQQEANEIRKIVNTFRKYMYAEKNGKLLNYPLKWKIHFLKAGGGANEYLPKPADCYLEGMTSVFNSTGNSFHEDGSPVEVDVTLSFKETKALTRDDIEGLQR
jgi:hypothetical protein